MLPIRSILAGLLVALVAYQFAPSRLLPVEDGDAIIVTGSHTGIGKHAALSLAREGYVVFACVRKPEHGDELIESAKKFNIDPSKLKPILLDVTNTEQIAAAVETVSTFVGDRGLYGLFNNAGIFQDQAKSVEHLALDSYRRVFEVNYFGFLQVSKAFLPLIRRRGGRIISNTSCAGFFSGPFVSAYSSSKFAVEAVSDSLRRELDPHGVKVSVLEPGIITTPIMSGFQELETFSGQGVYAQREVLHQKKMAKRVMDNAASPRVTSEAVIHAMRAINPKTRYIVGGLSGFMRLLAALPDTWADAILRADRDSEDGLITDQELGVLLKQSHDDDFVL